MQEGNNIEIRSEEVQEILGTPPKWIIRWGITIMLIVVMVLLGGSYVYKYPDMITARITILSENPPVQTVAKSDGKLEQLFVSNNQFVKQNEVLAIIENPASFDDAYRLLNKLDTLKLFFNKPEKFNEIEYNEDYQLGQYHTYYSSFIVQLRNYQTFMRFNTYDQRIFSLEKQIDDYKNYYEQLKEQISVLKEDYDLSRTQFNRDSLLFTQNIMSQVDFEQSKAGMLKQKYSWQNSMATLANTQITMNNFAQQIHEQEILKSEAGNQLLAALKERFDNLVSQLATWEQLYVLKSPIEGQITFINFWSENQYVKTGDVVFTIVPLEEQEIVGRAIIPIAGAGKISEGQRVNIKLDNYPYMEFGIVEGKIVNISKVPVITDQGAFYTSEILLVNHLTTNYNQSLPFSQEMQGIAEVITQDRRLIERLLDPLMSLIKGRVSITES